MFRDVALPGFETRCRGFVGFAKDSCVQVCSTVESGKCAATWMGLGVGGETCLQQEELAW